MDGLLIDSFAGGGGASTGIEAAMGRPVDIAINHDADALAMHEANHPATVHLSRNIWKIDPFDAVDGRRVAQALDVMAAWGFAYRSHVVWRKAELKPGASIDKAKCDRGGQSTGVVLGNGYWFRNAHELLLVGARGKPPAPAPGDQFPSIVDAPPQKHSQKPERFAELIEAYFPTLPKIELNRRGPARAGWDAWGNEACAPTAPNTGRV